MHDLRIPDDAAHRRKPIMLVFAIMLVPMIVVSSEPSGPPDPLYRFSVSGSVLSTAGGSVVDYTVVLMGRGGYFSSEWKRFDTSCSADDCDSARRTLQITDADGEFSLRACACYEPESLAVAIILPDTTIMDDAIVVAGLGVEEVEGAHVEDGFMCDSSVPYVRYYAYDDVDSTIVMVP